MQDWTPREHLRFDIAFAIARLPRSLLRRLLEEHVKDGPAALAAEHVLRQVELSFRFTETGLEKKPPAGDAAGRDGAR